MVFRKYLRNLMSEPHRDFAIDLRIKIVTFLIWLSHAKFYNHAFGSFTAIYRKRFRKISDNNFSPKSFSSGLIWGHVRLIFPGTPGFLTLRERSLFTGGGRGRCKSENRAHSKFPPSTTTHYVFAPLRRKYVEFLLTHDIVTFDVVVLTIVSSYFLSPWFIFICCHIVW